MGVDENGYWWRDEGRVGDFAIEGVGFIKGLLWGVDKGAFFGVVAADDGDALDPKFRPFSSWFEFEALKLRSDEGMEIGYDSRSRI